ncbi:hypothetical protein ACFL1R_07885 [Candidatus Latescibacterota bacterium]
MSTNYAQSTGRRDFLRGAAVAGAATLAGKDIAKAAPTLDRKLRIGVMGVRRSFISYTWSDLMEPDKEHNNPKHVGFGTPLLNMDITHVWDADPEDKQVQSFVKRLDATIVKKYDDMVGKVDGIVFGGFEDVPWQPQLARPYIEAGIPTIISRPFAYSIREIDELLDCAAKHNTPILATAKYEHYNQASSLKSKLENVGIINCVHATGNSRDYPKHWHIKFMILRILGYDVRHVSVLTDGIQRNTHLQETLLYNEGENQPPFPCAIQAAPNQDQFTVTIIGSKATVNASMLRSPDWHDSYLFRYAPQVIEMQRTFYGNLFEPLDNIRKKTMISLTGYYSYHERGGAPVNVGSFPTDWQPPYPEPGWIDESIFT